jgi:hypothetical protein
LEQDDLRDVLQAYAVRNPELGYTQGMGMIVGMLLMYMTPEDSFWTLAALVETVCLRMPDVVCHTAQPQYLQGMFTAGLAEIQIAASILFELLHRLVCPLPV